jgi:hypothetical protein
MGTSVVYPRFLGLDKNGDNVWELVSGRWTWGDDPVQAADRQRTWSPARYAEEYGAPQPLPGQVPPVQAEPVRDTGGPLGAPGRRGAYRALKAMLGQLDGWVQGCKENHEACDHRGEPRGGECWREFAPSDIRRMVNDAAREMGLDEFAEPEQGQAEEDKPL